MPKQGPTNNYKHTKISKIRRYTIWAHHTIQERLTTRTRRCKPNAQGSLLISYSNIQIFVVIYSMCLLVLKYAEGVFGQRCLLCYKANCKHSNNVHSHCARNVIMYSINQTFCKRIGFPILLAYCLQIRRHKQYLIFCC